MTMSDMIKAMNDRTNAELAARRTIEHEGFTYRDEDAPILNMIAAMDARIAGTAWMTK